MTQVIPVILCGGSGTRLWPLSRSGFPKQFLVLSGADKGESLFQEAFNRINACAEFAGEPGQTLIVTNEEHRFLVLDQLRELNNLKATLLLEPNGRNTAPALTLAALQSTQSPKTADSILVISPADQTVKNDAAFLEALKKSISIVEADRKNQTIVILGVLPTSPETGYGYIKSSNLKLGNHNETLVEKFVEKPDFETAEKYLAEGNYFWNSGIFVMRSSTWLSALNLFRPDIRSAAESAWQARTVDCHDSINFVRPDKSLFCNIPSESIDYAVIEKCPESSEFVVKMVELDAGWSDLGAWDAVWQVGGQDEFGNVTRGDTLLSNTKNSLIHANSRLVSAVGVSNLIVVETADAVMIADKKNSQDVKHIVSQLEVQKRVEKNLHRKVARPWGWYDSVDEGECFKVKRIQVKPGASLSLQMHHHRAEHWIVVKGMAEITNGDKVFILTENQSTYIPKGQTHRLTNPGDTPLEIIEVQSGLYLGEDDIVRFEDSYGRS
jgi:mannose-1-phosphate guanylyltransferase/mannose-6-phosphate isomerase